MPPEAEGGGVEPPRSCDPAVFETAYRARGSPSVSGPDRSRTCTSPGKSRELSFELRSQDVVGRDRTCDAPRFRRALYRLSFDHMSRRGWTRTSSFLFVRQALSAIELLAQGGGDARCAEVGQWLRPAAVAAASGVFAVIRRREAMGHRENSAPGQGIEPRSPRSERGVLPVRRSRIVPLRPAPCVGGRRKGTSVVKRRPAPRAEPPMSMPLAYPSTLDRRLRTCTSAGRRHRGGALEPESRARCAKYAGKSSR